MTNRYKIFENSNFQNNQKYVIGEEIKLDIYIKRAAYDSFFLFYFFIILTWRVLLKLKGKFWKISLYLWINTFLFLILFYINFSTWISNPYLFSFIWIIIFLYINISISDIVDKFNPNKIKVMWIRDMTQFKRNLNYRDSLSILNEHELDKNTIE